MALANIEALASGEGANGRVAMGVAVIGGMLVSTLLTLFIVPAMYNFISTDRKKKRLKNYSAQAAKA